MENSMRADFHLCVSHCVAALSIVLWVSRWERLSVWVCMCRCIRDDWLLQPEYKSSQWCNDNNSDCYADADCSAIKTTLFFFYVVFFHQIRFNLITYNLFFKLRRTIHTHDEAFGKPRADYWMKKCPVTRKTSCKPAYDEKKEIFFCSA